jgi:hypothetical protein
MGHRDLAVRLPPGGPGALVDFSVKGIYGIVLADLNNDPRRLDRIEPSRHRSAWVRLARSLVVRLQVVWTKVTVELTTP